MSTVERKMQVRPKKGRAAPFLMGLLRFLAVAVTTYLGLLAVTFFIGRVIPIDPALAIAGDHAPTQVLERLRREMHLDQPLYLQFYYYLISALSGDFGISVLTTNPVMDDIKRVFPATMELATVGTIIGAVFGVPFGVLAAVRRNSFIDQIVRVIGLVGYSVPVFWLAMVTLVIFYAKLNWVAYPGRIDIAYEYTFTPITGFFLLDSALQGQWDVFWDVFRHIILPFFMRLTITPTAVSLKSRSIHASPSLALNFAQEYQDNESFN